MREISNYYHLHLIYEPISYPDLIAFRESGYNPSSPKIAILVADLWTPSTYNFKCLFFYHFMQGCFAVHNITSTHHNISLGQFQRQCMVSTYFGYKVCIHESPLRAPELTPRLVGGIGVVHLFSLSSVVCFCIVCLRSVCCVPNVASLSGLSLWFSLPFIYYLNSLICLMCPMLPVSLNISFLIAPLVFSSV